MPAATAVPAASAGVPSLSQRGGRPAVSSRPAASAGTRSNRSGGATLRASPFVALPSSSSDDDDGRGDEDDDDDSDDGFVSKLRASSVGTRAARSVGGGGGGGGGGAAPAAASGERAGSVSRGRGTTSARSGHVANKVRRLREMQALQGPRTAARRSASGSRRHLPLPCAAGGAWARPRHTRQRAALVGVRGRWAGGHGASSHS